MRTSTAAWAAALAVMSMTGPFTLAEAAPARPADPDQLRPAYNHHDAIKRGLIPGLSLPPLLGGTAPTSTSSASPSRTGKAAKHDHLSAVNSLLGTGLLPLASSSSPSPTRTHKETSTGDIIVGLTTVLHRTTSTPTSTSSAEGLLPNVLGGLTTALPDVTHAVGSVVSQVVGTGGISNVLSQVTHTLASDLGKVTGTGGILPQITHGVDSIVSDVTGTKGIGAVTHAIVSDVTHILPTALPKITGTGGVLPGVVSDVTHAIPSGIVGPVTGLVPSLTGIVPSILSAVQSEVTGLPLAPLESQLESKLSEIAATVTNPALLSALTSGINSILTNAESSLGGAVNTLVSDASNIVPGATSLLGSVVSDITATLLPTGLPTLLPTGLPTLLPTGLPTILPTGLPTILPTGLPTLPTGLPTILPSGVPTGLPTGPLTVLPTGLPTGTPTGGITITGGGTTVVIPVPPVSVGTGPVTTPTAPVGPITTDTTQPTTTDHSVGATGLPTGTSAVIVTTEPAQTTPAVVPVPTDTLRTSTSTSASTEDIPDVSIRPTGTDSRTSMVLPTVWTFAPTPTPADTEGTASIQTASSTTLAASGGLATWLPKLVQPAGGLPEVGENYTLIQLGFLFGLNYPFVVSKPESATQIFSYLPKGLAYGLGVGKEHIIMNALMPYNTQDKLGYVTTLAQAYIPKEMVTQLQLDLHTSAAQIYYSPDTPVQQLMRMINPTIPILPGAAYDGLTEASSFNPKVAAGAGAGTANGAPLGGDASTSSNKVKGTSVGIGAAAVAGAAVYAAAIIYVARRYRQRRKGHQRASSVPATTDEMMQRSSVGTGGMGTFFMAGANGTGAPGTRGSSAAGSYNGGRFSRTSNGSSNGRSVREQGISAPLMSENSLGWN